jgi:retron-type reverse transcriptase
VPCKLLESIIKDKIMEHLLENNLIKDSQHGFMPGKSCATNLVEFMDVVSKAVDDGEAVDIFYLDFAKAFDKVPRQRLIAKLRAKGIEKGVVTWIEDWLTGRTQRVSIQGEQSEESSVDSGVPQGTVLGPTLFSVYIDDLESEIERRKLEVLVKKFADDTKGAKVIRSPEDRDKMQTALDCLCDWAETWGMAFNYGKCKVLHVGKKNPNYEYFMRGTKVRTTEEERDVGVTISANLKPAAQCTKAAGTATSVLNQLKRNFHYRDRFTFVRLYKQ